MNLRYGFSILIVAISLAAIWPATTVAAPPWGGFLTSKRVEADAQKPYSVGEENGPWMILACTFSGEGAKEQARQLVHELRKRYKLEAYTYQKKFEFGETTGRGIDPTGAPIRMQHRKNGLNEVAVMVGNYADVEDPDAQATLRKLKYSRPECLEIKEGSSTNQTLAGWRMMQRRAQEFFNSNNKEKGPMGHAFISSNPALPKDYFSNPGIDDLVWEMNKDVPHSLLKCRGKYTVQVATFKGHVEIDPGKIKEINRGKKIKSKLAEAARKSHELTEALRLKGWEAYEFHDRYASIVTVGSFDSVGVPQANGVIELNPGLHAIMTTFGGKPVDVPGNPGATTFKSLVGIPFDVQPIPVQVPRRSIGRQMARKSF